MSVREPGWRGRRRIEEAAEGGKGGEEEEEEEGVGVGVGVGVST